MSSKLRLFPAVSLIGVACGALLLAACGETDAPVPTHGPQRIEAPVPAAALPDCPAIAEALGPLTGGLAVVDPAGTRQTAPESHGLSCAWRSADDGAALGAIIIVDSQPLTEQDMRRAGLYVADPRVAALGGFIAFPDGQLDGDAILGPVGPQVIVGPVTVTLAGNARGGVADVTLDQAIDGAVAVHRRMR